MDTGLARVPHAPHVISNPADEIVSVEVFEVAPRWVFVEIATKQGLRGWGEGTLEGRHSTVAAELRRLGSFLIGADPDNIAFLYHQITTQPFYHTGPILMSALAGIDMALWDIKGKRYGCPVYSLLGGCVNNRINTYRWFGGNVPHADGPGSAVDQLETLLAGRSRSVMSYFKMNACGQLGYVDTEGTLERADRVLQALFDKVGLEKVRIGIDAHGRCKYPEADALLAIAEKYQPLVWFVEEPVRAETGPELVSRMVELKRRFPRVKLTTGERIYHQADFSPLLRAGCLAMVQIDLGHAGGITQARRVADEAAMFEVGFAPHCPNGPILLAASVQVQAYTPAYAIQESSFGIHYNEGRDLTWYLKNPEVLTPDADGFIAVPTGPGLGIEVDRGRVEEAAGQGILWDEAVHFLYRTDGGCPTDW